MASNIVAVSKEEHKNIKIRTNAGLGHTANSHVAPVVVNEFADVASNSPIVFIRDETNTRFRTATMLGLQAEECLFYSNEEWLGTHIPMNLGRIPFSIKQIGDGQTVGAAIDLDSDLVSETEGDALFDAEGNETEYFQRVNGFLSQLFEGEMATQKFVAALEQHNLLREFRLLTEDVNGLKRELTGLWMPASELLLKLDDKDVLELHNSGYLAAIHVAVQSMAQIKRLVKLHNQRNEPKIRNIRVEMLDAVQQDTQQDT
jgi:hypothetical protein